jgi:hypothetical protein
MLRSARPERFFTKRPPPASPQSFDEQVAQLQESTHEDGQVVPVRDVTQLDSAGTEQLMPLENGVERTVQPIKNAHNEDKSGSRQGRGSRITSKIPRAKLGPTRRTMTLERASRGIAASKAAKSGGGSHRAVFSRVPASTSAHRITLPPGVRGNTGHAVQSYIDSANRQMDKGNYSAAIAYYRRAWQVDGNSAAAKARLARARRAMQAENDIIANRR